MDNARTAVELETGRVYGELWEPYDDDLYMQSVQLFPTRWRANGEPEGYFQGKRCLDAGCGGGRYSIAMAMMGAESVVGMDVSQTGLADARRRAAALDMKQVVFQHGSVLDLPFPDREFDFVLCSGILHHTVGVERGMAELYRVVKPGGWVFLLLYGAGGLYWSSNLVMRPFADILGEQEVIRCLKAANLPANKRRTILDSLFCPILETYTEERVDFLLRGAGFREWRRWSEGRLDHESSPETLVSELELYAPLWEAGIPHADPMAAEILTNLAGVCRGVAKAGRDLLEQHQASLLSEEQLWWAVIGNGHQRIIAERPRER
jgi:ubiquinone/menaquinone biosynthesis C-methylase UbiE